MEMAIADIKNQILNELKNDFKAVDLLWSLFATAVENYKRDTLLKPFPPMFLKSDNTGEKDFENLEEVVLHFPSMGAILNTSATCLSDSQVELLNWILNSRRFKLKSHDKNKFDEIKVSTNHVSDVPAPNLIFEVIYNTAYQEKFNEICDGYETLFAYHGSSLENFYSILHNGLHSHLNKNSLFGEGTYLSTELSMALIYSRTGSNWSQSSLGENVSCVAMCQIIDHPDVKCLVKGKDSSCASIFKSSVKEGNNVPEKYYIVKNNEVLTIRYLLIYSDLPTTTQRNLPKKSIFVQHRFAFMMIFYFALLMFIGLANSKSLQFYIKKWMTN